MTKIGIVVGSVREGRVGDQIGNWILEQARATHPEAEFTVIDLKDYDLPMFDGRVAPMVLGGKYDNDAVAAWAKALDEQDGFIFVTSEYNHTIPRRLQERRRLHQPRANRQGCGFRGLLLGRRHPRC